MPCGSIRAVVGLGNPGVGYNSTRHNLGFMAIRCLERSSHIRKKRRYPGIMRVLNAEIEGFSVLLVKPLTFMNRSGLAVHEVVERFHIQPAEVLVLYDDYDLPLGRIRLRKKGSGGSHKGMSDIVRIMETTGIPRLRLGIGVDPLPDDKAAFVLSPFDSDEWPIVTAMLERAVTTVRTILMEGIDRTMSRLQEF